MSNPKFERAPILGGVDEMKSYYDSQNPHSGEKTPKAPASSDVDTMQRYYDSTNPHKKGGAGNDAE